MADAHSGTTLCSVGDLRFPLSEGPVPCFACKGIDRGLLLILGWDVVELRYIYLCARKADRGTGLYEKVTETFEHSDHQDYRVSKHAVCCKAVYN